MTTSSTFLDQSNARENSSCRILLFWVALPTPDSAKINSRNLPGKYSFRFPWPTSCSPEYLRWSSNAPATRSNKGIRCHRSHSRTHTISETRMENSYPSATKGSVTVQYPHEKEAPPDRASRSHSAPRRKTAPLACSVLVHALIGVFTLKGTKSKPRRDGRWQTPHSQHARPIRH